MIARRKVQPPQCMHAFIARYLAFGFSKNQSELFKFCSKRCPIRGGGNDIPLNNGKYMGSLILYLECQYRRGINKVQFLNMSSVVEEFPDLDEFPSFYARDGLKDLIYNNLKSPMALGS